jgi:hypothetical protein
MTSSTDDHWLSTPRRGVLRRIEPAFIARPDSAPVYLGFVVLDDVAADGFALARSPIGKGSPAKREMRS